jgi:predicted dehydrogenase
VSAKPLRIGVIGAGANTRALHLPRLRAIAGVEIVGVSNRSAASGTEVATEFAIPRVHADWRELVARPDVDAVVIGSWPDTHAEMSCAALAAGKHVLCEARMARNLAEARRMLAASESAPGLAAQLVPAPSTFRVDATIIRLLREGALGDLLAIDLRATQGSFIDRTSPLRWRQRIEISGRNTLALGIYYESLMRWVGEARRVTAIRRIFVPRRTDPETGATVDVRVPDHVEVLADMACGAIAHLRFSAVTGLPSEEAGVWLHGSEGTSKSTGRSCSLGGVAKQACGGSRSIRPGLASGGGAGFRRFNSAALAGEAHLLR